MADPSDILNTCINIKDLTRTPTLYDTLHGCGPLSYRATCHPIGIRASHAVEHLSVSWMCHVLRVDAKVLEAKSDLSVDGFVKF